MKQHEQTSLAQTLLKSGLTASTSSDQKHSRSRARTAKSSTSCHRTTSGLSETWTALTSMPQFKASKKAFPFLSSSPFDLRTKAATTLAMTQRLDVLEKAIASGVNTIDLELSIEDSSRTDLLAKANDAGVKVISSIHDTTTTPSAEELVNMVNEHAKEGEVFKFCGTVNDHQDALQIVEASYELKSSKHAFSMMALGNGGDWARLHAPVLGQSLVYATLRSEFKLSNKGLVNIRDLKNAWALMEY